MPGICYSLRYEKIFSIFMHHMQKFLRITIGNISEEQMKNLNIYLHLKGHFWFFTEQDFLPNNYRIDLMKLR